MDDDEKVAGQVAGLPSAHQSRLFEAAANFRDLISGKPVMEVYGVETERNAKFLAYRDVKLLALEGLSSEELTKLAHRYVESRYGF